MSSRSKSNGENGVGSDGKAMNSGIRKGRKRIKKVDARALENLLRWSIDLIERQQNLLKTALDVVAEDAE